MEQVVEHSYCLLPLEQSRLIVSLTGRDQKTSQASRNASFVVVPITGHKLSGPLKPITPRVEKFRRVSRTSGCTIEQLDSPAARLPAPATGNANLARVQFKSLRSGQLKGKTERLGSSFGQSPMVHPAKVVWRQLLLRVSDNYF